MVLVQVRLNQVPLLMVLEQRLLRLLPQRRQLTVLQAQQRKLMEPVW